VTYEIIGTPNKPQVRVNPLSALLPGLTRKIMEFPTGKPTNPVEFPQNNNN
jgi:hypothetical protein